MTGRRSAERVAAAAIAVAVGAGLAAPGRAAADPYGEPPPERDGFLVGAGLGPALFLGAGEEMDELQGIGGDLNLRIGTTAGERLLWLIELQTGGYVIEVTSDVAEPDSTYNALATLTVGGQLYVRDALWLRGGVGLAGFAEQEGRSGPEVPGSRRGGLGLTSGIGYDFFRRRNVAMSIEGVSALGLFRQGALGRGAMLLAITFY